MKSPPPAGRRALPERLQLHCDDLPPNENDPAQAVPAHLILCDTPGQKRLLRRRSSSFCAGGTLLSPGALTCGDNVALEDNHAGHEEEDVAFNTPPRMYQISVQSVQDSTPATPPRMYQLVHHKTFQKSADFATFRSPVSPVTPLPLPRLRRAGSFCDSTVAYTSTRKMMRGARSSTSSVTSRSSTFSEVDVLPAPSQPTHWKFILAFIAIVLMVAQPAACFLGVSLGLLSPTSQSPLVDKAPALQLTPQSRSTVSRHSFNGPKMLIEPTTTAVAIGVLHNKALDGLEYLGVGQPRGGRSRILYDGKTVTRCNKHIQLSTHKKLGLRKSRQIARRVQSYAAEPQLALESATAFARRLSDELCESYLLEEQAPAKATFVQETIQDVITDALEKIDNFHADAPVSKFISKSMDVDVLHHQLTPLFKNLDISLLDLIHSADHHSVATFAKTVFVTLAQTAS